MAINKIDSTEVDKIAASFLKIESEDSEVIEQALADKHDISIEVFHDICNHLFSMIDLSVSPVTKTPFIGFGNGRYWIAKKEITNKFINAVIQWISEDDDFEGVNGYSRDITNNGKKEFEITIKKYPLKEKTHE